MIEFYPLKDCKYHAKCIKIGYPRYDNMPSIKHSKSIIYDEIKSINASKPLLLWMPTMIKK